MKNTILAIAVSVLTMLSGLATAKEWVEGRHYRVFEKPHQATENTVIEWFWLGCPHCQELEPVITEWSEDSKPDNVDFIQFPALMGQGWGVDASAVAMARELGIYQEEKEKLYQLRTREGTQALMVYMKGKVDEMIPTQEEKTQLAKQAMEKIKTQNAPITQHYQYVITGVPFVLVNGTYYIDNRNVQKEEFPELIDYLLTLKSGHK